MPSDPALYPNVVKAVLQERLERPVTVSVVARAGSDTRETWRTVTKDRHVMFEVLMGADAVIVGVGSFDHAPTGIPAAVETMSSLVRPAWVRRQVRRGMRLVHPIGVRATLGRYTRLPRGEFERLYDGVLLQVRSLARGAAGVAMGPTSHRSAYYGGTHPAHPDRARLQASIAARHGFPLVQSWPLVQSSTDELNPDGIHWPPPAHAAVGSALAGPLIEQLTGERETPPAPQWG